MAYTTIKYGASGDDVKTLQNYLNQNGYNLSADGQFGAKTQAAVKDYQNKNGLIADGIVGTNTWKSFGNSTQNNTVNKNTVLKSTSSATTNKENVRPTYSASKEVSSAQKALEEWEGKKPQEYKSQYSGDINTLLDSILNGEKFSYDTADDELYKIYKEQYQNQGKLSMQNTVAQSAELTGGYGSSYGTAAGQQAYQQYLTELNNIIPELRDRAYQQYQDERTGKIQNLSLLQQQDDSAYSRYRDGVDDYNMVAGTSVSVAQWIRLPAGSYTISDGTTGGMTPYIAATFYGDKNNTSGTNLGEVNTRYVGKSRTITTNKTCDVKLLLYTSNSAKSKFTLYPQLEIGAMATEYEQYVAETETSVSSDGEAYITSISRNMTIIVPQDDVDVEIRYNKDINCAIESFETRYAKDVQEIKNAIISLGGNI